VHFVNLSNFGIKEFADIHTKHEKIAKMIPIDTEQCLLLINEACILYQPNKRFALLGDYKDNYLVDLSHQSKSILVSNDKDFAPLHKLKRPKVRVVTIKEFYTVIVL
jgi:putative PIN family toxin of toxin-antitoxin system